MTRVDRRYAEIMSRLTPLSVGVALFIQAITIAWLWKTPRLLLISVSAFVVLIALNVLITLFLIKRWGAPRAELVRIAISTVGSLLTNHLIGWPLPTWLWLPMQGLAYDGHRRMNWTVLVVCCATTDTLSLIDGVSWMWPAAFTTIALLARLFTDARLAVLRDMFDRSEAQREELDAAHAQLKAEIVAREQAEMELRQAQKLEAIGRLASGVAHEISTPLQFVSCSMQFVDDAVMDLLRLFALNGGHFASTEATECAKAIDLPLLTTEIPKALRLSQDGLGRITDIVRSMRRLAHPDGKEMKPVDINEAVNTSATIAASEYKLVADLAMDLAPMPTVVGNAGEIQQVMLNLIVNAAHAVADTGKRGRITLRTRCDGEAATIAVGDTGAGIPESIRDRIFDPFFTTKSVGRGTGQGLAIVQRIVSRHAGTLTFDTSPMGTTFCVSLPVK